MDTPTSGSTLLLPDAYKVEAATSKAKDFSKGSKRRVRQIRWTRYELFHALVLLLVMAAVTVYLVTWLEIHGL